MNDHPQWIIKYGYRNRNPKIVRWHDHSEIAQVTSETDAPLIAAAPELLAALKNAEEQLRETAKAIKEVNGLPLGTWTLTLNAANEARAAISKAEA